MENKEIVFSHLGQLIPVKIIYKNNKNMYMRLKDQKIVLICPFNFSEKLIRNFVEKNLSSFVKTMEKKENFNFLDFEKKILFLFNEKMTFKILFSELEDVKLIDNTLYFLNNNYSEKQIQNQINHFLDRQLNEYLIQKVSELEKQWKFKTHQIKVVKSSSFWGKNKINTNLLEFNRSLVFYPTWVIDYVVAHELAHDLEQNHRKNFWKIVEKIYPLYKKAILELKNK